MRTLNEEISRVIRARATNPVWLAGMMRHGPNGAAEIAETVDNLFAFAALSEATETRHFDLLFDAVCGDEAVRVFLERENPRAARAIAEKFTEAEQRGYLDVAAQFHRCHSCRNEGRAMTMIDALRKGWRPVDDLRKGWCPGALAPMLSGDGYIFRLRLVNGSLSFERARKFAELARRYGNGAFDLSARANLQMRGVGVEDIPALQAELAALGLLNSDLRAEAVRNIVPSPLAGFDPTALIDARPLVEVLDALLIRRRRCTISRLNSAFRSMVGACCRCAASRPI